MMSSIHFILFYERYLYMHVYVCMCKTHMHIKIYTQIEVLRCHSATHGKAAIDT
jgi:hypothetical protein